MTSKSEPPHALLHTELLTLDEEQLRRVLVDFFNRKFNVQTINVHGSEEHGADIEIMIKPDADPLGKPQVLLIQVKAKNLTLSDWHEQVCGQLTELYSKPYEIQGADGFASRRIILINSKEIKTSVHTAIRNWNSKLPIPIEVIEGWQLAEFLHMNDYALEDLKKALVDTNIAPQTESPEIKRL